MNVVYLTLNGTKITHNISGHDFYLHQHIEKKSHVRDYFLEMNQFEILLRYLHYIRLGLKGVIA